MKTKTFILVCFTCFVSFLYAQDYIIKKNGEEIKAKVLEVAPNEIRYKKHDNLQGATYVILSKDVFMIKYENGTSDVLNPIEEKKEQQEEEKKEEEPETPIMKDASFSKRLPGVSWVLSFLLPSAGQYYNHQEAKGAVITTLFVTSALVFLFSPIYIDCYGYYDSWGFYQVNCYSTPSAGVYIGAVGVIGTWLFSWIDAPVSASAINKKYGLTNKLTVHPYYSFVYDKPSFGARIAFSF